MAEFHEYLDRGLDRHRARVPGSRVAQPIVRFRRRTGRALLPARVPRASVPESPAILNRAKQSACCLHQNQRRLVRAWAVVVTEFRAVTIYLESPVSLGFTRARPICVGELRPIEETGTGDMARFGKKTISRRTVEALKVEKDTVFWDSELPGFGVRVHPSGRKVYIAQTRGWPATQLQERAAPSQPAARRANRGPGTAPQ